MVARSLAIAALVALASAVAPNADAKVEGGLSGSLSPGVDTNPRRVVGQSSEIDGFLAATGNAFGRLTLDGIHVLGARYDLGLKKFWTQDSEDLIVQQLDLDYLARLGALALGVDASGKLRLSRGGTRDYSDMSGEGFADWSLSRTLAARLTLGARYFDYPPDNAYSSFGPKAGLSVRVQPVRALGFAVGLIGARPVYEGMARNPDGELTDVGRCDRQLAAQLQASWRGPLVVQATYLWSGVWSNSFGESSQRHRIAAALTARLPGSIFASLHAAWQRIHYPDGLFLSKELLDLMLYDDESQSSVAVKLARPLSRAIDAELKYAVYWIELPNQGDEPSLSYLRQMAAVGISARW
jgi:hypothetical protein